MSIPNIAESRKHARYTAQHRIIALPLNDLCELSDVSEGGVGFKCLGKGDLPPEFLLEILIKNHNFHASVPVKLVWEKNIDSPSSSTIFNKCIGAKFDNLTEENKFMIDYLIRTLQEHKA